jgi:methylenetetrahydrofolate reductase (NADPH)
MPDARYRNLLRERLGRREFAAAIEFVTPEASEPLEGAIAPAIELAERIKGDGRVDTIAVTDRVKSDRDHDPVVVASHVAEACGAAPTVHLSGKDRDPAWLDGALGRARAAGLENLLLITGDRVKDEPSGRRVRYHDSVNMVMQARAAGAFHVAAAVSPFKYREEELMNQYLKMAKKERAGADCFITQVGWDMLKLKELMTYRARRGLGAPVMAGVMLLTVARARYIRAHRLAGITVTDELQARLEQEAARPDRGVGAAYRRLALQIVGARRLGLHGFQLTGLHQFDKLDRLLRQVDALDRELPDEAAWWAAWRHALGGEDGAPVATAPSGAFYLYAELGEPGGDLVPAERLTLREGATDAAARREVRTFRVLDRVDQAVFRPGSPGAALLAPVARLVPPGSAADRALHWAERRIKQPIVGCQTCGFCRLPFTSYVCPETCPKGLANGPCGGSSDGTCEFGDRPCIHDRKYRIAKAAGHLHQLEEELIPPVDPSTRGTCSWTNHFRGTDPDIIRLPDVARIPTARVGGTAGSAPVGGCGGGAAVAPPHGESESESERTRQ